MGGDRKNLFAQAGARRRRRRPQPGNQRQDVREHQSRYRDLGHLEGDVAAVADDLRADLDQFSRIADRETSRGRRDLCDARKLKLTPVRQGKEIRFAADSSVEGTGFEPSVPPWFLVGRTAALVFRAGAM